MVNTSQETQALYIHWPFCQSKCPYCDFNSHVRPNGIDEADFLQAYLQEIQTIAARTPNKTITSIFFGGGTPSLMAPQTVQTLLDHVAKVWRLDDQIEISLEANPSSVEAMRFAGYRQAGVNRVSIGIQAFNDKDLKTLGRLHTVAEAETALEIAQNNFDQVSFDLIYARPHQSPKQWEQELLYALSKDPHHLSLYQLTIEPGTRFADLYALGKLKIPNSERAEQHFLITQNLCEQEGLEAYEISNHAKEGHECRHNLTYWRYGNYAGIGPGAHGRIESIGKRFATATEPNPEIWRQKVRQQGHGLSVDEEISAEDQALEQLLMGLRLTEGLNIKAMRDKTGFQPNETKIEPLIAEGLIVQNKDYLRITSQGRFVLNYVITHIAESLENTIKAQQNMTEITGSHYANA